MEKLSKYTSHLITFLLGGLLVFSFCWFNPRIEKVPNPIEVTKVVEKTIYEPVKVTETIAIGQTITGQEKTPGNDSDVLVEDVQVNTAKVSAVDSSGKVWGTWKIQPTLKKHEPYFMNNQVKLGTQIYSEVKIDIDPFVKYAIDKERKKNTAGLYQLGSTSIGSYGREIKPHVKVHVLYGRDWPEKKHEYGTGISIDF